MPGFVQHYATAGYGYVDPGVERVRNMVPLFDSAVMRLEPYVPPVIQKADQCIDTVYGSAEKQVTVLQEKKASLQGKVSELRSSAADRVNLMIKKLLDGGLVIVESSEAIVDRCLPPTEEEQALAKTNNKSDGLLPRPFRMIPRRINNIVFVKCSQVSDCTMHVKVGVQSRLSHGAGYVSNRVSSAAQPGVLALQSGRDAVTYRFRIVYSSMVDAQTAVVVYVSEQGQIFATRLRLPAFKQWALTTMDGLKQGTVALATKTTQRASAAVTYVVGEQRSEAIFSKLGAKKAGETQHELELAHTATAESREQYVSAPSDEKEVTKTVVAHQELVYTSTEELSAQHATVPRDEEAREAS